MFRKIVFPILLLLLFTVILLVGGCNSQDPVVEKKSTIIHEPFTDLATTSVPKPVASTKKTDTEIKEPVSDKKAEPESNEPVPIMSEEEKELAVAIIVGYREVTAAEITQENSILDLVLVVKLGTGNTIAKKLGDQYIRTVKTVGPDENPATYGNRQIGTGKFNYYIGIYYPDKTELLMGTKFAVDSTISW